MDGFAHNRSTSFPAPRPDALPEDVSKNDALKSAERRQDLSQEAVLPKDSFYRAIDDVIAWSICTFQAEIEQKQLYYHGLDHVQGVARRSLLIFDTVVPFLSAPAPQSGLQSGLQSSPQTVSHWRRQRELLRLSAIAHDMIQLFLPDAEPNRPRQRETGLSEAETFRRLKARMSSCVADECAADDGVEKAGECVFTAADIEIVEQAIAATVCEVDPADGGLYQPILYHRFSVSPDSSAKAVISLVSRCLALADIGTLGIDGIEAYQQEGTLLLIEENLDIVAFVQGLQSFDSVAQERLRQRLLRRARFQVVFARSRLTRLDAELSGLPAGAVEQLKQTVFYHLTPETIAQLEKITPTDENASLSKLLDFFQLSAYL